MDKVKEFEKISKEQCELYVDKNKAYGDSFGKTFSRLGIISAITRIEDKYNRLVNLVKNPNIDDLGESIEDTLRDMSNYCIMTIIELNKTKGGTNDKEI